MKWTRLTLITVAALALSACSSPTTSSISAVDLPDDAPLVAFYGDSYTLGTGASDVSNRWSTRIAAERGWREFNPSVNGLGFVARRGATGPDLPSSIIDAKPDYVFITMGLNDAYSFESPTEDIRQQINADFDRLTTALPDARFIVVEPFWYTDIRPDSLDIVSEWVKQAAEGIDADYISGASGWIQGREGEMAQDGLHPNDAGYDLMTRRMEEALAALGI